MLMLNFTLKFYSYCRNSLPNPPPTVTPVSFTNEDKHRGSKLLSSPGTEHNDLVMSSNLECRQGPFLESPGNFNDDPQGFFLVWKFKEEKNRLWHPNQSNFFFLSW